jgi:phosphatidylserine/phosphatidylglycerophosphate/cardiolipin synthase-like enzyme
MRQREREMKERGIAHNHIGLSIIIVVLFLSSCAFPVTIQPTPSPTQPVNTDGVTNDHLQVYFTDPSAPHSQDYRGGPDGILANEIDEARLSVDVAAYSFNLWSIRNALIHAHQRGVVVRMVMESDNMDVPEVQQILDAGIPIIGDQHEGLMHNKFIVIDRSVVWTGSMNFTVGGAYRDNNNLVRIQSAKAAKDYTSEFEEMFIHHLFGPDVLPNTPYPKIDLDGIPIEIYFSPDDKVAARILALIKIATTNISFMAYTFTSNDIGEAIIQKSQTGVSVAGVMDESLVNGGEGTEYDPFKQAGLNVRLDGNGVGLMHHKVIIIDRRIVITGSYNFTASAEKSNDENVVIIYDSTLANKYMDEFQRIYNQAQHP